MYVRRHNSRPYYMYIEWCLFRLLWRKQSCVYVCMYLCVCVCACVCARTSVATCIISKCLEPLFDVCMEPSVRINCWNEMNMVSHRMALHIVYFTLYCSIQCVPVYPSYFEGYRKISNIRHTKSQHSDDSHLVLKSSLHNPFKPGVNSRMKM